MKENSKPSNTVRRKGHGFGWIWSYLRIGLIGFGGGSALIPVIEHEVVDRTHLISKEDYDRDVLIASVTPGALPIGISSNNGKRIAGLPGMLAAAVCMALPGAIIAVVLLGLFSVSSGAILEQIQFIAIGVTGFILSLLTVYIASTISRAKQIGRLSIGIGIIVVVLLVNSGSSATKLLDSLGIQGVAIPSISTIDILMLVFFILLYTHGRLTAKRVIPGGIVVVLYLMSISDVPVLSNDIICHALQLLMLCLAIYSVVVNRSEHVKLHKESLRGLLTEEGLWLIVLVVLSIPAIFVFGDYFVYLARGLFSSVISFGGGDAYLTVADGLFISDDAAAATITTNDFYSKVVTVVNVVPGSILCKTLASIGYLLGIDATGTIAGGIAVAVAGFAISIVGTCAVISLAHYLFKIFENLYEFELIKRWIRAIVSGLLIAVILSLLATCFNTGQTYDVSLVGIALDVAVFYLLNLILIRRTNMGGGLQVAITLVGSFIVGNVMLVL